MIKIFFNQITPIENEAWQDFEQYFSKRTLKKNEILWQTGNVCKHLVFINSGLIRSYQNTGDKEITTQFYLENSVFYDDFSFISQKSCNFSYQALEETDLIVIPRVAVYLMFDKYKSFERLGRMAIEQQHILTIETQFNLKNLSSKEKYLKLIAEKPTILQRIPLKLIASYLNMTPEYLSKLRKELAETSLA